MLERFRICLLHPHYIGKFIIEKMWKIWVLLLILILLNAGAAFGLYYMNKDLTVYDKQAITSTMLSDSELELNYTDHTLTGSSRSYAFSSSDSYIVYGFFIDAAKNDPNNIYFIYQTNYVSVYVGNLLFKSVSYSDLNIADFIVNSESNINNQFSLTSFIEAPFKALEPMLLGINTFSEAFQIIITCLILMLVAFIFGYGTNQTIKGKYRLSLLLHSLIPYLTLNLLGLLFNVGFINYIGMFLSIIYFFISLRSIVKVEGGK